MTEKLPGIKYNWGPKKIVSLILIDIGSILLALSIYGLFAGPVSNEISIKSKEEESPNHYYQRTIDHRQAQERINKLSHSCQGEPCARELLDIISNSYAHTRTDSYRIMPWDNWIMWLSSLFDPRYSLSQDTDLLWRRGAGFCDQAVMIYVEQARKLGLRAAIFWLQGHVIATVGFKDINSNSEVVHMLDPDLGIYWPYHPNLIGSDELSCKSIKRTIKDHGYSKRLAKKLAEFYCTVEDNQISDSPPDPNRAREEHYSNYAKWWIPIALIMLGIIGFKFKRLSV
jgi:hypothetical protein